MQMKTRNAENDVCKLELKDGMQISQTQLEGGVICYWQKWPISSRHLVTIEMNANEY